MSGPTAPNASAPAKANIPPTQDDDEGLIGARPADEGKPLAGVEGERSGPAPVKLNTWTPALSLSGVVLGTAGTSFKLKGTSFYDAGGKVCLDFYRARNALTTGEFMGIGAGGCYSPLYDGERKLSHQASANFRITLFDRTLDLGAGFALLLHPQETTTIKALDLQVAPRWFPAPLMTVPNIRFFVEPGIGFGGLWGDGGKVFAQGLLSLGIQTGW